MKRLTHTFVATLALSSAAPAQAPILSPIRSLTGDALPAASAGGRDNPVIEPGGAGALAVWADHKSKLIDTQTDFDIYAVRLDASGARLDATAIPLAVVPGAQTEPRAAWNGSSWLVVFESQLPTSGYYGSGVQAVRIAPDGTVLDATPFTVFPPGNSTLSYFDVAANGSEWLVVWEGTSAGENSIRGVRLAADGTRLTPTPIELVPADYYLYFNLRLVSAGGEYLVAYTGLNSPVAQRFNLALQPIGASFALPTTQITSNGASYYLNWTTSANVVGSPMSTTGALAFPAGVPIASSNGASGLALPSWDGTQWWNAWWDGWNGVRVARVNAAGTTLDPGGRLVGPPALPGGEIRAPVIGGLASGGACVAWTTYATQFIDIRATPLGAAGQIAAEFDMAYSAPAQTHPDLAAAPHGYFAAFTSRTSGLTRVLVDRLDASGQSLDAQPLLVAASATISTARIAWDGQRFLVVWGDNGAIKARRIATNGTFIDAAPFNVMTGYSPDVAGLNGAFLVVCVQPEPYPQYVDALAGRVDGATGALLDPAPLLIGGSYARNPRVTTFGNRWLATWQQNWSHDSTIATVVYAFVDPSGSFSAASGIQTVTGQPAVAASASEALFVWRTASDGNANANIAAQRMLPSGVLTGPVINVYSGPGMQTWPDVEFDGTNFVVAWEDQRNQSSFFDATTDIYGQRISPSGVLLDGTGFVWANRTIASARPSLATHNGGVLCAFSELHPEQPLGAYRVATRGLVETCAQPTSYCTSLANSSGASAAIGWTGHASFTTNDLTLTCSGLPSGVNGSFFMGATPLANGVPFANGLRCVAVPLVRFPLFATSNGVGSQLQDFSTAQYMGVAPGDTRFFQSWFRDGAGGGSFSNLTNALAVTFCP